MLNEKYQALLDQYDISVSHTRRGRGCVLCFGENDVYALSQTSLSEERLCAVSEWTLAMHDHHFYKTDQYILNKDGYFLTFDRYYETFALRKTYLGTECDIHALKETPINKTIKTGIMIVLTRSTPPLTPPATTTVVAIRKTRTQIIGSADLLINPVKNVSEAAL